MLSDVKIVDVARKIKEGNEKCEADQKAILDTYKARAKDERLAVRQKWAADKKKWEAFKAVLEIETDDE